MQFPKHTTQTLSSPAVSNACWGRVPGRRNRSGLERLVAGVCYKAVSAPLGAVGRTGGQISNIKHGVAKDEGMKKRPARSREPLGTGHELLVVSSWLSGSPPCQGGVRGGRTRGWNIEYRTRNDEGRRKCRHAIAQGREGEFVWPKAMVNRSVGKKNPLWSPLAMGTKKKPGRFERAGLWILVSRMHCVLSDGSILSRRALCSKSSSVPSGRRER